MLSGMRPAMRNLLIVTIVGLIIRYVVGVVFTYPRDFGSWILNAENFLMNEGVYGLPGHYYPPTWGYIMAAITGLTSILGMRISIPNPWYTGSSSAYPWETSLPSMEYALLIKTVLFIADILVAYGLYRIVMHVSGDERKALAAYAIWFLFPLVIVMSSMRVMFECVEIMFMVWAVVMVLEDRPFIGGLLMGVSLMTKPYAMFLAVLLIGFAFARRSSMRDPISYFSGAVVSVLVMMLPVILSGQLDESLSWLLTRAGKVGDVDYYNTFYLIPIGLVIAVVGSLLIAVYRIVSVRVLMALTLMSTGFLLIEAGNIQYYLILLPPVILLLEERLIWIIIVIMLLMSYYAAISFTSENVELYAAYGLWGWEALVDLGQRLYPYDSTLDYSWLKSFAGYSAILIPVFLAVKSYYRREGASHA